MKNSLFVISDLHLGGEPGFQICSQDGQVRLADFIQYVAAQKTDDQDVHLVLNGDIVDFLAEQEFSSFTGDDATARAKLTEIIKNTRQVWDSLRHFVAVGARLTVMLGNHDIELSLPGARKLLMDTIGEGRVEFIYDNQALVVGPVLIEHGNRYDGWNVVSHDALRAIRSAMSRGEKPLEYLGPAGSQLVQSVMNPIKAQYPFVDLLKPENSGMLPILAVLDPAAMKNVARLATLAAKSKQARFDENGIPLDQQNIAAVGQSLQDDSLKFALSLAGMDDPQNIAAMGEAKGFWERLQNAASEAAKNAQLNMLLRALRHYAETARQAFDVGHEDRGYLLPANAAATNGHKIIIYGHTHLAKRVNLDKPGTLYLNTGTWADLMKLPDAILGADEDLARKQLEIFLDDLGQGRLDTWRGQIPTFARLDFDNDILTKQNIYLYQGKGVAEPVPAGQLSLNSYTRTP